MSENIPLDFYIELGKRIAKYRNEIGYTQIQLAEKLNVSQQLIAAYELGTRRIHVQFLLKLSNILYISIDELLGIKPIKNKPGPVSKIQLKLEEIKHLPLNKQKLILESLDTLIKGAKQKVS